MTGLATITLAAAILAVGAGIASATRLCDISSCEPTDTYPTNTPLAASLQEGTQLQLLSSLVNVKCQSSAIIGKTLEEAGEPLALEITGLSFGECEQKGNECTVTTTALPTSPSLQATGEGNGTLSLAGGAMNFKCGALIICTYATPTLQVEGGNPASLSVAELKLTRIKGICPAESFLDATYAVSEPAPVYVVE